MANVTTGKQWVIDTASASAITTDSLAIKQIKWVPGTTGVAGDECKVTDNTGTPQVLFDEFATGANDDVFQMDYEKYRVVNGLIVSTLAHGKVYIMLW